MKRFNGSVIKKLREEKSLNQTQFSKIIGIHSSDISKFERNLKVPGETAIQKIADYFDVPLNTFYKETVTAHVSNAVKPSSNPSQSLQEVADKLDSEQTLAEETHEPSVDLSIMDKFVDGTYLVKYEGEFYRASLDKL